MAEQSWMDRWEKSEERRNKLYARIDALYEAIVLKNYLPLSSLHGAANSPSETVQQPSIDASDALSNSNEILSSMEPDGSDSDTDSIVNEILPPSGQTDSLGEMKFLVEAVTQTNDVDDEALTAMMIEENQTHVQIDQCTTISLVNAPSMTKKITEKTILEDSGSNMMITAMEPPSIDSLGVATVPIERPPWEPPDRQPCYATLESSSTKCNVFVEISLRSISSSYMNAINIPTRPGMQSTSLSRPPSKPPDQHVSNAHPSPPNSIGLNESSWQSSLTLQFSLQNTFSVVNCHVFDEMPLRNRVQKTELPHQFRDMVTRAEVSNTPIRLPPPKPPDANHEAEGIAVLMSLFLVLSRHHFQHGINLNLDLMSHIFRGRCGNLGDHIPLINRTYSFGVYVFKSSFAFHDELAGVLSRGEIKLAKLLNSKLDTNILHLLAHIATGCLPFSISDEVAIIALASNTKVLKGQILLDSISSLKGLTNFMQQQTQFALYALRDTQPSTTFDMFNSLLMEWLINPSFTKDCVVAFVPISFAPVLENTLSITMLKFNFYVQTFIVVVTVAVGAIKNSVDAAINGFSTFKNAHYIFQPIGDILVLSQQAATWFPMVQGDSYLHVGIVALETIGLFELLLAAGCVPFNAADAKNVSLAQQFSKEILVIFPTVLELLVHTCCVCSSPIKEVWIMSSVWKKLAGASLSIPKDTVSKHHSYGIHDNCKLKVVNPSSYSQAFGANVHKVTHGKHASFKGCDASVLLNNTATIVSEQEAFPNINSLRGFDVVNQIKTVVEKVCPNTVSGADILSLVVQISSVMSPGPDWKVPLGRRDGLTANQSRANQNLPAPFNSLNQSKAVFAAQGLTTIDLVALSDCNNVPGKHIVAWAVSFENSKPLISQPLEDTSLGDAPLVGTSLNNKEVWQWDPGGSSHILWDGLFVLQANWKVAIVIQHCYFSFNLEDKVAFKGEGIVMNPKAKGMQVKAQGRLGNYGTTINRHLCMERRLSSELY